eukprot:11518-Heterococcus_DN1.PRE.1
MTCSAVRLALLSQSPHRHGIDHIPIYSYSHHMVKLPTLSNKVVQTSSETTSEVHVRSAVEDVK